MNFAALKSVISQGLYCLDPYNYVSFRVLHQMANLLGMNTAKDIYEPVEVEDED